MVLLAFNFIDTTDVSTKRVWSAVLLLAGGFACCILYPHLGVLSTVMYIPPTSWGIKFADAALTALVVVSCAGAMHKPAKVLGGVLREAKLAYLFGYDAATSIANRNAPNATAPSSPALPPPPQTDSVVTGRRPRTPRRL